MPKKKGSSTDESECFQAKMMLLRKTSLCYVFGGRGKEAYLLYFEFFCMFYPSMHSTGREKEIVTLTIMHSSNFLMRCTKSCCPPT